MQPWCAWESSLRIIKKSSFQTSDPLCIHNIRSNNANKTQIKTDSYTNLRFRAICMQSFLEIWTSKSISSISGNRRPTSASFYFRTVRIWKVRKSVHQLNIINWSKADVTRGNFWSNVARQPWAMFLSTGHQVRDRRTHNQSDRKLSPIVNGKVPKQHCSKNVAL